MNCLLVKGIELICMVIMFGLVHFLYSKLKKEQKIIKELQDDLSSCKSTNTNKNFQQIIDQHKVDSMLLETINKIQKNYSVFKKDKIIIIEWIAVTFNSNNSYLLFNGINVAKKYTFQNACENIRDYILRKQNSEISLEETLSSLFYLITK